jgi:hypothetical protein
MRHGSLSSNALILVHLFLFTTLFGGLAFGETVCLLWSNGEREVLDTNQSRFEKRAPDKVLGTKNITWNIRYDDPPGTGFLDGSLGATRRTRLEETLAYVADVINEDGVIDVEVEPSIYDTNTTELGFGGTYFRFGASFQGGAVLERFRTGEKPHEELPELFLRMNFGWDWYSGTGSPGESEVDLLSSMLVVVTHGLGLIDGIVASGESDIAEGVYPNFDRYVILGETGQPLFSGNPPTFQGTPSDLTSNDVFFNGPAAFARYGRGISPQLYAPDPFTPYSIGHWDGGNIAGDPVMINGLSRGVAKRRYQPVDIGALIDIGYNRADTAGQSFALTTMVTGEGTIDRSPDRVNYSPGQEVMLTAVADDGWEFVQWSGNVTNRNNETTSIVINGDTVVEALFQLESSPALRLLINIEGSGSVTRTPDTPTYTSGTQVTLTATPAVGHRFAGWEGDVAVASAATTTITMNSDKAVTVVFEEIPATETLVVEILGSGSVQKTPDKPLYVRGETVQLSAQALPGWQFSRWIGLVQNPNSAIATVVMNSNLVVVAVFVEREDLQLQTIVQGQGLVERTPEQLSYTAGQRVDLKAVPSVGWRFVEWRGPVNNRVQPQTFLVLNSDVTVTAAFAPAPTDLRLTVSQRGEGTVFRLPEAESYRADTRVELTAAPALGWRFEQWEGNVSSPLTPTTDVLMQDDEEVIVNFVPALAQLVVAPDAEEVLFPPAEVSGASEVVFTVRNGGGGQVVGEAQLEGGPFEFGSERSYRLAPGESQEVVVRFVPTQAGDFEALLSFNGGEGGAVSVTLLGSAAKVGNASCGGAGNGGVSPWGDLAVVLGVAVLLAGLGGRREGLGARV